MSQHLSFFNWSLRKLLSTESDSFNRAKLRILFIILLFSLFKLVIAIPIALYHDQIFQVQRSLIMITCGLILLKILLSNKIHLKVISHLIIWIGIVFIWSNVFISAQTINIIILQFVFMLILSSFYLLNQFFGILYSVISTLPVVLYLLAGKDLALINRYPGELASPGFEIIILLNFITIIISHYLYHQALSANVAEKETLNRQLQVAVEEANRAAQSKSDFLSTMSHELRTPLNSVIGMSELVMNDPYSEEQAENLKILNFSALNLHSLINDILDYNKLGSDRLDLEEISVNLHKLINDICAGVGFQAKEKGLNLVIDIDDALKDQHFISDPTRITQVIYNLTGNAIKFTSSGSVSVKLKMISMDEDNALIRFSITDTGIGISSDKHTAIFEPFIQASTSTTRNFGGTGLGLAIVKRLLLLFNSEIQLESTPGNGSTFYFDICFRIDKKPVNIHSVNNEPMYDLTGLKILAAEDNPMNRLLLKKILSKWNNDPVFVVNGNEAVEKLLTEQFNVILMDIHMPVMDGYEATKAIRAIPDPKKSEIPIIALTASVSNNLADKIKQAGMDDYIYKPFNSKDLYLKLKSLSVRTSELL